MKSKKYTFLRLSKCDKIPRFRKSQLGTMTALLISFASFGQVQVSYYELENGLLLDIANSSVIVMNPDGGIGSLEMSNGNVNWESDQAAKPLAVYRGSLIAQQEAGEVGNILKLAQMNPTNGNVTRLREKTLNKDVIVSVASRLESNFNLHVDIVNDQLDVKYDFVKAPVTLIEDSQKDNGAIFLTRKFRMNSSTLNMDSIANTGDPTPQWQSQEFYTNQLNSSYPGRQFKAIQNNFRVAVEKIADDREWLKYEWTVFSSNGARVGSIKSHFSFRPFYVQNGLIIFTTVPFERMINGELISEPKSIRAYNLTTGNEVWSKEVRDLQYRGPLPE